jgi:acetyl-CoA carboxylase biotin carboxyl carrier protein
MSDGPELTPEDVKEILRLVDESGLEELDLETPRFTVRFRRGGEPAAREPRAGADRDTPARVEAGHLVEVTAPMVGTVYRAMAPGEPPFVEVGSTVEDETTVCIIEVMKLMNSIAAGVRGTVVEVCFENATPVQYGDVLYRVLPR